jgi:two-component system nitrate/nitrite response regulator NarL
MARAGSQLQIIIADRHPMIAEALRARLDLEPDLHVVGVAAFCCEVLEFSRQAKVDLVIADTVDEDPSALDIARALAQHADSPRVIAVSSLDDDQTLAAALAAGVTAFVARSSSIGDLLAAVRGTRTSPVSVVVGLPDSRLSPREHEVLALVARGHTSVEAATQLGVTPKTIDTYRERLRRKLGARSRAQLVSAARELGML